MLERGRAPSYMNEVRGRGQGQDTLTSNYWKVRDASPWIRMTTDVIGSYSVHSSSATGSSCCKRRLPSLYVQLNNYTYCIPHRARSLPQQNHKAIAEHRLLNIGRGKMGS